jgi:hypothetical protein
MGKDVPLAVWSTEPRPVFDFFKQLFARVTSPSIDPIREESLACPVGPETNLLKVGHRMVVAHPVLSLQEMHAMMILAGTQV